MNHKPVTDIHVGIVNRLAIEHQYATRPRDIYRKPTKMSRQCSPIVEFHQISPQKPARNHMPEKDWRVLAEIAEPIPQDLISRKNTVIIVLFLVSTLKHLQIKKPRH